MVRIAFPVATIAFWGPRRRAMRRCRAPRKPSPVRATVAAMLPRVAASQGLPLARPLFLRLPADSWVDGQNLAQDTRWAADGKPAHVDPHLGDELLRGDGAGAGDLGELLRLMDERGDRLFDHRVQ